MNKITTDTSLCYVLYIVAVTCLPLPEIEHGSREEIKASASDQANGFGSIWEYTCNPGYEISGTPFRMCTSSKEWSGDETFCIRKIVFYIIHLKIMF